MYMRQRHCMHRGSKTATKPIVPANKDGNGESYSDPDPEHDRNESDHLYIDVHWISALSAWAGSTKRNKLLVVIDMNLALNPRRSATSSISTSTIPIERNAGERLNPKSHTFSSGKHHFPLLSDVHFQVMRSSGTRLRCLRDIAREDARPAIRPPFPRPPHTTACSRAQQWIEDMVSVLPHKIQLS